jgi:hypothetical protein
MKHAHPHSTAYYDKIAQRDFVKQRKKDHKCRQTFITKFRNLYTHRIRREKAWDIFASMVRETIRSDQTKNSSRS